MNLGITTSFMIAGMIFLGIVMMNLRLSQSTTEMTLNQNARQNVQTVADMLNYDIPKIGYNRVTKLDTLMIKVADSKKLVFRSNIDNDDSGTVETITWQFTSNKVTTTENPNDYVLFRIQNNDTTRITLGITHFNIRYYDVYGEGRIDSMATPVSSSDIEKIRQIEFEIVGESPEPLSNIGSSGGRYLRSAWEKRYSPGNLESF